MNHVVLLGDSIFDNAAYVPGQSDVIQQVRAKLPRAWSATLLARDGAVTRDVPTQLKSLPNDASNIIISVGGNDALSAAHILFENVRSVAEAVMKLSVVQVQFTTEYQAMLDAVLERELPTVVCMIYDGHADSAIQQRINVTALSLFNDVITREALRHGLPIIDLRIICNEPDDYANPIEPSAQGGEKIAAAIADFVMSGGSLPRSQVFTSARIE
jgi:lysophospholipase L1-like esterase